MVGGQLVIRCIQTPTSGGYLIVTKFDFIPQGWRLLVNERVLEGDYYWNRKDWLPVLDGMINHRVKYDVVRRKHVGS